MSLPVTAHREINEALADLLAGIQRTLGQRLVGLYLYGSAVTGGFDTQNSDLDFLAVIIDDLDKRELVLLRRMHADFASRRPTWEDRIEVQYASVKALKTFKSQPSMMAVISPGEPFHVVEARANWTMNWYDVQENGLTLHGPAPHTLIEPISREEFVRSVREHVDHWQQYVLELSNRRGSHAYAVLTMCRALYTCTTGEQVSKGHAATWAEKQLPDWADVIREAADVRSGPRSDQYADSEAMRESTRRFIDFVRAIIVKT